MKQFPDIRAHGRLCAITCLFAAAMLCMPTGCAKPSESGTKNIGVPEPATNTTAARGVMRSGVRNRKTAAKQ